MRQEAPGRSKENVPDAFPLLGSGWCRIISASRAALGRGLSTLTHFSFWEAGFSLWKASPHSCEKNKRDIQRLDHWSEFLNLTRRQTPGCSYLCPVLACIRNHLCANDQIYRPRERHIPVAEALLSSLLCIFPATYRLPHCVLQVLPVLLPFSLKLNFIILILSWCEFVQVYQLLQSYNALCQPRISF